MKVKTKSDNSKRQFVTERSKAVLFFVLPYCDVCFLQPCGHLFVWKWLIFCFYCV